MFKKYIDGNEIDSILFFLIRVNNKNDFEDLSKVIL